MFRPSVAAFAWMLSGTVFLFLGFGPSEARAQHGHGNSHGSSHSHNYNHNYYHHNNYHNNYHHGYYHNYHYPHNYYHNHSYRTSYYGRQRYYYGPWVHEADANRSYTCFWYKSDPEDEDFRCHYCYYYPSRPNRLFFYSPYAKVYYGYYDTADGGYHVCNRDDRSARLSAIPASAWSSQRYQMPDIPGASDGESMPKPPAPPE